MIVAGMFSHCADDQFKNLTYDEYRLLRTVIRDLPENREEFRSYSVMYRDMMLTVEELGVVTSLGLSFEVKKATHKSLFPAGTVPEPHPMQGQTIHVHIPSIGLLMVDEVTWLEDSCTQVLQEYLDEGWRILAVCPPNLQRRPDYILGRTKKV